MMNKRLAFLLGLLVLVAGLTVGSNIGLQITNTETTEQKVYASTVEVEVSKIETSETVFNLLDPSKPPTTNTDPGGRVSTGTAFHIGNGYFVTAYHVVEAEIESKECGIDIALILPDGFEALAIYVGGYRGFDVAILRCEEFSYLPALDLSTEPMSLGDEVIVCGNGFSLGLLVSRGIFSGELSSLKINLGGRLNPLLRLYATDAAVNQGSSGGPVCNDKGEVIGINSAIISRAGGYDGISIHVPIIHVNRVMKSIIAVEN